MKLRSRKITIGASISAMLLAGAVIVGAAEYKTTDKDIENVSTINNNKSVISVMEENDADAVVSIEPVTKDIVMGSVSDILAASETENIESEMSKEEETEQVKSEYDDKFMTNIDECLNIRAAADADADIVGKLYAGAGGTVLEKGDNWTKITSGNVEGYVATEYLLFGEDAQKKAEEVGTIKVTVKEDCIRVRKEADVNAEVIGLAELDKVYYANNISTDWIQIEFEDSLGYISTEYANAEFVIASAISIEEELEQIRLEEEKRKQEELEEQRRLEAAEEDDEEVSYVSNSQSAETVVTSSYDADVDDAYLLACLVEAEAGCEPYEGKLAVANVVLNRVNSSSFGNSIESVIYANGQFSVVNNGSLSRALANGPSSECVRAANEALSGVNNVPNYLYFRMTYIANYASYNSYTVIGSQVYYN